MHSAVEQEVIVATGPTIAASGDQRPGEGLTKRADVTLVAASGLQFALDVAIITSPRDTSAAEDVNRAELAKRNAYGLLQEDQHLVGGEKFFPCVWHMAAEPSPGLLQLVSIIAQAKLLRGPQNRTRFELIRCVISEASRALAVQQFRILRGSGPVLFV